MVELIQENQAPTEPEADEIETGEVEDAETVTADDEPEETGLLSREKKDGSEEVSIEDIFKSDVEKAKEDTPKWLQKRLDKMAAEKNQAIREKEEAIKKARELEEKVSVPKTLPKAPVPLNYSTDEEYQDAMEKYVFDLTSYRQGEAKRLEQEEQEKAQFESNSARFREQANRLSERLPDYDDVVKGTSYGDDLERAIHESDQSGILAYYFGKNPSKIVEFNSLGSRSRIDRELGKLEARITNLGNNGKASGLSLINPVKTGSDKVEKKTKDMSDAEYYEHWKKKKMESLKSQYREV